MKAPIQILAIVATVLLAFSCTSTERLVDSGDYEKAITRISKKLERSNKKKTEDVKLLETTFNRMYAQDMREVEILRSNGSVSNLERALAILRQVERRQDMVAPYLPLVSRDGYRARLQFAATEDALPETRIALADALNQEAGHLLEAARNGDREAGRMAYDMYGRLVQLVGSDAYYREMKNEAKQLGVTTLLVDFEVNDYLPQSAYLRTILPGIVETYGSEWVNVVANRGGEYAADYRVNLYVRDVRLGDNRIRNEETPRTRRISDGWDYVLDQNGNVLKDSTGNDIKIERFVNVRGVAVRTIQERKADLSAVLEITDLRTNTLVASYPIEADARFSHTARSFYGDSRALQSSERVFISPRSFPGDAEMMEDLVRDLRPRYNRMIDKFLKSHFSA